MKVYQAYVEYKLKSVPGPKLLNKHHGEQYYSSPSGAQVDIDYFKKHPAVFNVLHSEILELDAPDTLCMQGIVHESGQYEDRHVYLQEDVMTFTIDTTVRNHFLGRRVKITVELLED